ncbi:MAG: hypothetical protein ACOC7N_03890 [Chloroflexota bacterium]
MMRRREVAWILLEEAIRAMALFGVLVFGVVVHIVRLFDVPAGPALLGALGLALLGFVLFVTLRLKTGREFKVKSRRGTIILGALLVFYIVLVGALAVMLGPQMRWRWWRVAAAIGVPALFTWFNSRFIARNG